MGNALFSSFAKKCTPPPPPREEGSSVDQETWRPWSQETWRPWSDLPDLVLHIILMNARNIKADTVFSGVCRRWRSIVMDVMAFQPLMPMVIHLTASRTKISLFSLCENRIYSGLFVPKEMHDQIEVYTIDGLTDMGFMGPVYSRGHLIMRKGRCSLYRIPVVVNPWTGATWEFPDPPNFWYRAVLSAVPTSPDCVLVVTSYECVQWCRIGDSKWSSWTHPYYPDTKTWSGTNALVLRDKIYWCDWEGRVLEMDMLDYSYTTTDDNKPWPQLIDAPDCGHCWHSLNSAMPVEVGGELLMVNYPTPCYCHAFRLDLSSTMKKWVKVESLGHHSIVISHSSCEAYDTKIVEGLLNNCVYRHILKTAKRKDEKTSSSSRPIFFDEESRLARGEMLCPLMERILIDYSS